MKTLIKLFSAAFVLFVAPQVTAQASTSATPAPILIIANPLYPYDSTGTSHYFDQGYPTGIIATRVAAQARREDWYTLPTYTDPTKSGTVWSVLDMTLDTKHNKMYWIDYYGINVGTIGGCSNKLSCSKLLYSAADLDTSIGYEYTTGITLDVANNLIYAGVFNNTLHKFQIKKMSMTHNPSSIQVLSSADNIPNGGGLGSLALFNGKIYWTNEATVDAENGVFWGSLTDNTNGVITSGNEFSDSPWGLAIDRTNLMIYWANWTDGTAGPSGSIGAAHLTEPYDPFQILRPDNCGNVADDILAGPNGLAFDYHTNRVTWGNWNYNSEGDPGSGRVDKPQTQCLFIESNQADMVANGQVIAHGQSGAVAYLYAPEFVGSATATFQTRTHAVLNCAATFEVDRPEAHTFVGPTTVKYSWTLNGKSVPGSKSTLRAVKAGKYKCTVSGANYAGSTSSTSSALTVTAAQAK